MTLIAVVELVGVLCILLGIRGEKNAIWKGE